MSTLRLALSLFLLLAITACSKPAEEEVESETVVPVTTEPASTGSIRATIGVTGTVTPAPGADLVVVAPEAARIAEITRAEGDRVSRGEVLVRFEIPSLVSDVASKRGELARAQARLANARTAQTRAKDLFDRGVGSRKEMEDADRELAEAEAGVTEAMATQAASQTAADRAVVRAAFDGVVAKRMHNAGDLVEAAASDPVIRIVDPRRLELTAEVPVADAARITVGAAARMADPAGGTAATLRVVSRPAAVDANTATAPIRLAFAATTTLPVGSTVQITIDAEEHKNVVLVPTKAVVHEADDIAVFVANGDKAERRVVTLGIEGPENTEVRSGVKIGDAIIVTGQAGLPDGASITTARPTAKAEPEK